MAQVGGRRPGAGRKPGKVSAAKRALAEMAKEHAESALQSLAEIAKSGESEAARVSAAVAILDRAFGKPPQAVHLENSDDDASPLSLTFNVQPAERDVRVTKP